MVSMWEAARQIDYGFSYISGRPVSMYARNVEAFQGWGPATSLGWNYYKGLIDVGSYFI